MLKIKTSDLNKVIKSKKDFILFNVNEKNEVTNYTLTNNYKLNSGFNHFRVVSTIQKQYDFITIK